MKDHSEILKDLKTIVKEEINDCKKFNTALNKEMQTSRAYKYNQIPSLLEAQTINNDHKRKYEAVLQILNTIKF